MSRSLAREDAFKLIFEMAITKISANEAIDYLFSTVNKNNEMWAQYFINASNRKYIETIIKGVEEQHSFLNSKIEPTLKQWPISRISKVSLAILQLATYEIYFMEDIPVKVSANEAVLLAKKYAGHDEIAFINGVIGTIIEADNKTEENK